MRFLVRSAIAQYKLRGRSVGTARDFSSSPNNSGRNLFEEFWTKKVTLGQALTAFLFYKLLTVARDMAAEEE